MKISKRIIISFLILATIALFFWSQSRVPALNQKAMMAGRTVVDAIAFDVVLAAADDAPLYKRIAYTTVNWSYTNWKGMTFGVLFAAAFLTLLGFLPPRRSSNRFVSTLKGMFTGIPLGVCVNCATPIAQGMHHAGVRLETVLAALISSPTLNVIVLSMAFSLLPLQFAVIKVLATLFFVLILIPLIVRRFYTDVTVEPHAQQEIATATGGSFLLNKFFNRNPLKQSTVCLTEEAAKAIEAAESWLAAIRLTVTTYLKELFYIFRITVPFMLLAGLLGAIMIEVVPTATLSELEFSLLVLFAVALVGTFLPVPIAFDIIMVSILLAAGIAPAVGMTLLFTLGIFSIYPFMIIWRNMSRQVAMGMFVATLSVGVMAGYVAQVYESFSADKITTVFNKRFVEQDARHMLTTARKYCGELSDKPQANACLGDYILARFKAGTGPAMCDVLKQDGEQKLWRACENAYAIGATVLQAVQSRNIEYCRHIELPVLKLRCEQEVIQEKINLGGSIKLCEHFKGHNNQLYCRREGIHTKINKINHASVCGELSSSVERKECLSNVRISTISSGMEPANCEKLETSAERAFCYRVIAFRRIDEGAGRESCSEQLQHRDRIDCLNHAAMQVAVRNADKDMCKTITVYEKAKQCQKKATLSRIAQEVSAYRMSQISNMYASENSEVKVKTLSDTIPSAPPMAKKAFYQDTGVQIDAIDYLSRQAGHSRLFTRHDGAEYGINGARNLSLVEFREPFVLARGIAAGDYNNDGWPDLLMASSKGIYLYQNMGGSFVQRKFSVHEINHLNTFVVAFVDINNDGWQDIFVTAYGGKNYFVLNDKKGFSRPEVRAVKENGSVLGMAAGFADIDNNAYLDLIIGNWSFGAEKAFIETLSGNRLFKNSKSGLEEIRLQELKGETLSTLFSDINKDGMVDLLVANDRDIPDLYYYGNGAGQFRQVRHADKIFPAVPFNSMGIDSADFNNDLLLDIFSVDMSFKQGGSTSYCEAIGDKNSRQRCEFLLEGAQQIKKANIDWCSSLKNNSDRNDCMVAIYRDLAIRLKQPARCENIPAAYTTQREFCRLMTKQVKRDIRFIVDEYLPQVQSNRLLLATNYGKFTDASETMGVTQSFWSWNAKAADLDNDGWQDIYVGNGYRFGEDANEIHSNIFYHNQQGKRFTIAQQEFGLADDINTPSYTYIDFDNDGDLDIVATGVNAPARVYVNHESLNNTISFELRDTKGNHFGIGSKIYIYYGENDHKQQMRELKLSGGYLSFDAPIAYFGLGKETKIYKLIIEWPGGERMELNKEFPANKRYIIKK